MFHGMLLATSTLALFTLVSASLYPTQPIQSTVYYAGETALTTWIDDGSFPSLSNMGLITIQLYTDSNVRPPTILVVEREVRMLAHLILRRHTSGRWLRT